MIYAWGLAFSLTLVAGVLDSSESLTSKLKPGIGEGTCFMKSMANKPSLLLLLLSNFIMIFLFPHSDDPFTQGLFFFLPLTIIFSVNIAFYVLTALKIRQVQRELEKVTSNKESSINQRHLNNKKTK